MSDDGVSAPEIARFFRTRSRTVYTWFNRQETAGVVGLMILPRRGRSAVLNDCDADKIGIIEEAVSESPQSLREALKKCWSASDVTFLLILKNRKCRLLNGYTLSPRFVYIITNSIHIAATAESARCAPGRTGEPVSCPGPVLP